MPNGYRRRSPYYSYAPPSPLHYLLGGVGTGITQGVERLIKEKERKRSMADQVIENVLQGMDPRLFATESGKSWLERQGIYRDPDIQDVIFQAQTKAGLLGPGGMGPPAPFTLPKYQEQLQSEIDAEEEKKIQAELAVLERKERLKLQIKKESQPSPEDIAETMKTLTKFGLNPEDVSVNIDGVNYNLQTALEKIKTNRELAKEREGAKDTWDARHQAYLKKSSGYREKRTRLVNSIASIGTGGELPDKIKNEFPLLAALMAKGKGDSPEDRRRVAIREANKNIAAWNKEMQNEGRRLKLKPKDITQYGKIKAVTLEEELPEPATVADTANVIIAPKPPDVPTEEEINTLGQTIFDMGLKDENGNPMTMEVARDLARRHLGKK